MSLIAKQLEKYPFVRLVVPLMAGIWCGEACPEEWKMYVAVCMGISGLLLFFLYRHTLAFGITLFLFLFFSGVEGLLLQKERTTVSWAEERTLYTGLITDKALEKPRTYLFPVEVKEHKIYLYVRKDSLSATLRRGDRILFYTQIESPRRQAVPGMFDYGRYLQRQGIAGTAYVDSGYWKQTQMLPQPFSFKRKALDWRDHLLERYEELGFQGDELAVLSALTLGDKSGLKEEVKETYSITGASHVLALSGLHLGILYGICAFILSFLHAGRFTHLVRACCLMAVLWGFAVMVGLSASVVRSACMFSLFAIGQCLNRKRLSLNTLALSAFLMLLYQPYYLFDVGFQLSYAAVASIVCFYSKVSAWWQPLNRVLRYLWGIMAVSLVAQLGVAPLIVYYFSRFSVYFLLTNLLVIPVTFCLVAGTLVMLACGFYAPLQSGVAVILNEGIKAMHVGLRWIEQLPYSAIDRLKMDEWSLLFFYLLLLFVLLYSRRREARSLIGMLASVVGLLGVYGSSLFADTPSRLLFYHSAQGASVQCAYAGKEPFELFSEETRQGIYRFSGKTVALLKDNRWRNKESDSPLPLDYLFIQRGFTGKIADLQQLFAIRHIVLDTSLSAYWQKRLREECETLGIKVFMLAEKGYLWIEV